MLTLLLFELCAARYAIYECCCNKLLKTFAFDVTCRFEPPCRAESHYEFFL